MSNSSNRLLAKLSKPPDAVTTHILRTASKASAALDLDYFVTGAVARDLMLVNVFGMRPGPATRDVDFGVAVEGWGQLESLKRLLCDSGRFRLEPKVPHRLFFSPGEGESEVPVDLIPFGGVADAASQIAWPPKKDVVMNVAGFREAQASAIRVEIGEDLIVPVASLAGLTILKLLAWQDRGTATENRDATDLERILRLYGDAGNFDRLYDPEFSTMLEEAGYDIEIAGARLLGRDAAAICQADTYRRIEAILRSSELTEKLLGHFVQTNPSYREQAQRGTASLNMFRRGFLETSASSSESDEG